MQLKLPLQGSVKGATGMAMGPVRVVAAGSSQLTANFHRCSCAWSAEV